MAKIEPVRKTGNNLTGSIENKINELVACINSLQKDPLGVKASKSFVNLYDVVTYYDKYENTHPAMVVGVEAERNGKKPEITLIYEDNLRWTISREPDVPFKDDISQPGFPYWEHRVV